MPQFPLPLDVLLPLLGALDVIPGTSPAATTDQAQLIVWGVVSVILNTALSALAVIFSGLRVFRRTPPLHETFATKKELEDLTERVDAKERGLATRIDGKEKDLTEIFRELRTISKALGHLEGLEKLIEANQKSADARFRQIDERLKEITNRLD